MTSHQVVTDSPYARAGSTLVDQGYSAIPCKPQSKISGVYRGGEWFNETDWTRFCERLPTHIETDIWSKWPDAGVCIALGFNDVVAVDIDSDQHEIVAAIESALPDISFVQKAGRKGRTLFYRAGPAVVSRAFSINGERVLDLLCKGKQTVVPPTIHKDTGRPYAWLSGTLEHVSPENLPMLPDDIAERLAEALKPFGYEAPVERSQPVGESDGTWDDVKAMALANLDCWVGDLGIDAKRQRNGTWRAQAKWRNGDGFNVSFHPTGIKDYGDGDRGMSAIDVVMAALDMDFGDAVDWLKGKLGVKDLPRLHLEFRKASEAESEADWLPPDPIDIVHMVRGVPDDALALAEDDGEMAVWIACRRQEVEVFSEGVTSAIERFPADVFERHCVSAIVAVAYDFDKARDLGFAVEVSHIVSWLESAFNALQSEPETEVVGEAEAPTGDVQPKQEQAEQRKRADGGKFNLQWLRDLELDLNGQWLFKKIFPRAGVVSFYGDSRSFKTFLMIHASYCAATAYAFAGRVVKNPGPVVYIAAEDGRGVKMRVLGYHVANATRNGLPPREGIPLAVVDNAPMLGTSPGDLEELIAKIETALQAAGYGAPSMIVVDTLNQTLGSEDESNKGMQAFMSNVTELARRFQCCVVAVNHVGHAEKERERGGSQIKGNAEVRIWVERKDDAPVMVAGVKTFKTILHVVKMKNAEDGFAIEATLREVPLGKDEDGEEERTLAVVDLKELEETAEAKGEKPASKRESMRREFCSAYHQLANDVEPTRGLDGKPVRKVKVEAIRDLLKKRGHLDVDDDGALTPKGRTAFKDAKASLIGTGKDQSFIQDGDLIWLLYPDRPFTFKKSHDKTKAGPRLTASEEKALTALATAIGTSGLSVAVGVSEEEGYPAGVAFVTRAQWRDEFEADDRRCDDDGPNAFERTVAALIEKGLVKNGGDHFWLLPAAGASMGWKKK